MLSVISSEHKHGDMLSFPHESGFLGAFAKCEKRLLVMSVLPSAWNNSAHTLRIFV
jgi:hypothetical protein